MYLTAEFHEPRAAAAAIAALKERGAGPADLDVFSTEPVPFARGVLDRPTRMSLVSILGAIALGTLATSFIYYAQHDYPLITGGMPLYSFWATGIITYEMTMLGSILATFLWFLWEGGILRRRGPAPKVEPGVICLRVQCDREKAAATREALQRAGAANLKTLEGA
jgi:Protein of unknown function (DUF3341)